MDPNVGAQYRWSARFAPIWNRFFGLVQGWITVFAWMACSTSYPAIVASQAVNLAAFNHPTYVPERWHVTLCMWASTLLPFVGNLFLPKFINPFEMAGAVAHVLSFLVGIITLLAKAKKSPAEYVFQTLTNDVSGWTNPAVAWGMGLLTMSMPLCGTLFSRLET